MGGGHARKRDACDQTFLSRKRPEPFRRRSQRVVVGGVCVRAYVHLVMCITTAGSACERTNKVTFVAETLYDVINSRFVVRVVRGGPERRNFGRRLIFHSARPRIIMYTARHALFFRRGQPTAAAESSSATIIRRAQNTPDARVRTCL